MKYIVVGVLILLNLCSAELTDFAGPNNTVCLNGSESVTMTCYFDHENNRIQWYYSPTFESDLRSIKNNPKYDKINVTKGQSLVIKTIGLQDAGFYHCAIFLNSKADDANQKAAGRLMVLLSDPNCEVDNTTVIENHYIQLNCRISYTGEWTPTTKCIQLDLQDNDHFVNDTTSVYSTYSENTTIYYKTTSVKRLAKPNQMPIYFECRTYFTANDSYLQSLATKNVTDNVPSYSHTWKSPVINILYGPRNVSIVPTTDVVYPGDILTCSGSGNPEPVYEWINLKTKEVFKGHEFRFIDLMMREEPYILQCVAINQLSKNSSSITVKVIGRPPVVTTINIVTAIICASLMIVIIIVIIHKYRKDKNTKGSNFAAESRRQRDEPNVVDINERNEELPGDYVQIREPGKGPDIISVEAKKKTPAYTGADGTIYVQMNGSDNLENPASNLYAQPSRFNFSTYASIDHTHEVPNRLN